MQARRLNPRNADHPMNLARMYTTWATYVDPSKWPLADKYYNIGTSLARNNGRYADEWGAADLQHADPVAQQANQPGYQLTPRQKLSLYNQALAHFKQAVKEDDLLSDALAYQGDTYERIAALYAGNPTVFKNSAAMATKAHLEAAHAYAVALKMDKSWGFELPVHTPTVPGAPNDAAVLNSYITALREANDYTPLVKPLIVQGVNVYNGQSPVQAAASAPYSTTFGLQPSAPYSPTLEQTQAVLRQKGLLK
jgi:tetratricopeptide (TPR) repeat protein